MDRPIESTEQSRKRVMQLGRWLIGIGVLVALVYALRWIIAPSVARDELRVATVERGQVVASISASAQVVPRNEQMISGLFASEVIEVVARAGDSVVSGDVLLRLDARTLESTVRDLGEQRALKDNQRRSAQLDLERILNESRGKQKLLEIDLEGRRARHHRLEQLVEKGAISTGELSEAALDVRRTQVELGQLLSSIENQQAVAEAELERIRLEASILDNQMAEQRRLMASAEVTAPRSGVVTWVLDQPGLAVAPGALLARVADLSSFRVEAQVSDFYSQRLSPGLDVNIMVGDQALTGTVDAILPTVEGGAMSLLIELSDPTAEVLRPRLRVDVEIITARADNALSVKNGPAIGEDGRQFVYRIVDSEAIRTRVDLGVASRHDVQILDGLTEGDEIIISDVRDLQHLERFKVD